MIHSNKCLLILALLAYVLACFVFSVKAELAATSLRNPCTIKLTCHECIQTQSCAWCMQPYHGDNPRCFEQSSFNTCPEEFIWSPDSIQSVTTNRELTRAGYASGIAVDSSFDDIIQISPQRISLKLRTNEAHRLRMRYSQAKDYPLDLYYLMGLPKTMEDMDKSLSLGELLSETLSNTTSDFRLGFGYFTDKMLKPKNIANACPGCAAPYGYKNAMSLSSDIHRFSMELKKSADLSNLVDPEGGLDAIMQAIVCPQQIGWREQARRLLVFSTNAGFHYASDGKLVDAMAPNDGECHLNSDGLYTRSMTQDYPSISQINHRVKQSYINIIFAVTANQQPIYRKLSYDIEGSYSGILANDSSNVAELVKAEYSKISSSVEMKDNATSDVEINYYSSCLYGSERLTSKCSGLKVGDVVEFTIEILVKSCPTDPSEWNQIIEIYSVGSTDRLVIDLELLCSCPCDKLGKNYQCSSTKALKKRDINIKCRADIATPLDCNGRGTCLNGACECIKRPSPEETISGRYCECDNFSCNRHKQQLCSGPDHGVCECGTCLCHPDWTGSACECRASSVTCIPPNGGEICSGPDHGVCECGTCLCHPDWTGAACECRASSDTCIPPNGGEICSGHGECECGECKCTSTEEERFSGKYCEKCPTCPGRCQELKDCVKCQMYKTGDLKNNCLANCTTFVPAGVKKVEIDDEKEEYFCTFYDEDDCKFDFKYSEKYGKLQVQAQQKRQCPKSGIFSFFG